MWRSWWFLSACGCGRGLLIYLLYRYRLAQLLAVANVRTRIATDLHDDIGASLSEIAILSEVAPAGRRERDTKRHAARRDRQNFARTGGFHERYRVGHQSGSRPAQQPGISHAPFRHGSARRAGHRLEFRSSVADHDLRIGANERRQIYLIFKEAMHNIARHSGASRVEAELDRAGDDLILHLRDNGKGFDTNAPSEGHGLLKSKRRAAALGAELEWRSAPGQGTALKMRVRLETVDKPVNTEGQDKRPFPLGC